MNKRGGIGMVEVPYRATGQMLQETAAGTTQAMISSFAAVVGFARDGKVRRIAISSAQRFPGVDDLPTIGETLPGFEIDGWLVVAPAGTPPDILARLNREIDQFLRKPDVQQRLNLWGWRSAAPTRRRRPRTSSGASRRNGARSRRSSTCSRNEEPQSASTR